jgi:hypothetical protein
MLRAFADQPNISAYHGIHRKPYDFLSHPLAPCGTLIVLHNSIRETWDNFGHIGFYLGPRLTQRQAPPGIDHHRTREATSSDGISNKNPLGIASSSPQIPSWTTTASYGTRSRYPARSIPKSRTYSRSARYARIFAATNMPTAHQLRPAHQPAHYFVPPSHQNCGTLSKHIRPFARFYSRLNPSHPNRSAYLLKALEMKDGDVESNTELFPHECVFFAGSDSDAPIPEPTDTLNLDSNGKPLTRIITPSFISLPRTRNQLHSHL